MGKQTNYSPTFPMFPGAASVVTPSDTVDLANPSIIYVGVGGSVKVSTVQGDAVTFVGVLAGGVIPVQVTRVWATGTSATNMLRIY